MSDNKTTASAPAADAGGRAQLATIDVLAMDRYAETCRPSDIRELAQDWLALAAERDRLRAECERLRGAALETVASYREWLDNDVGSTHVTDRHSRAMIRLRDALAATPQPAALDQDQEADHA